MKNYEQKYKEALKVIEGLYNVVKYQSSSDALLTFKTLEKAFPELADSEDEKIRKGLIKGLSAMRDIHKHQTFSDDAININDAIAWLEKQGKKTIFEDVNEAALQYVDTCPVDGRVTHDNINEPYWNNHSMMAAYKAGWLEKQGEQKPTWSEEDEKFLNYAISLTDDVQIKNFLKSLKDRVQPQPKQEWSEYDKIQLSEAIQMIEANGTWIRSEDAVKKVSNWLKSIKPNYWKPSEEQMEAFEHFVRSIGESGYASPYDDNTNLLYSLINDLKNL